MLNAKLDLMPESAPSLRSHVSVAGHTMRPLAAGALYWEDEDTLLVADLHLEKGAAFAALGMLLPPYDTRTTLERLSKAIRENQGLIAVELAAEAGEMVAGMSCPDYFQAHVTSEGIGRWEELHGIELPRLDSARVA